MTRPRVRPRSDSGTLMTAMQLKTLMFGLPELPKSGMENGNEVVAGYSNGWVVMLPTEVHPFQFATPAPPE